MSFRGLLRPGQGFQLYRVLRRECGTTQTGRPFTKELSQTGAFYGIVSQASPKEKEQWKQNGNPITHTIVQRGTQQCAKATDVLELMPDQPLEVGEKPRRFLVKGMPHNPGELGHFLVYVVEERADLQ